MFGEVQHINQRVLSTSAGVFKSSGFSHEDCFVSEL